MDGTEFSEWLYHETFTAAVNQMYSQVMAWRWGFVDVVANVLIGALSVFGIATAAGKIKKLGKYGFPTALVSVFFVLLLLIVPTGAYKNDYYRDYQAWTDIRQSLEDLTRDFQASKNPSPVSEAMIDRQKEINTRVAAVTMNESATWRTVMIRCEEDWTEHLYGKGIRTPEDVDRYRKQMKSAGDAKGGGGVASN